jgi:hypothetical protein
MEFIAEGLNAAAEVDDDGECLHDMQEKGGRASAASLAVTALKLPSTDLAALLKSLGY